MTTDEQQRHEAFVQALKAAEQAFGFTIASTIHVDGLGAVVSLEASHIKPGPITIVPLPGWQPQSELPKAGV